MIITSLLTVRQDVTSRLSSVSWQFYLRWNKKKQNHFFVCQKTCWSDTWLSHKVYRFSALQQIRKKTKPKITIPPYFSSLIEKNGVRLGMCFVVDVSAIFCILIVRCYGFFASKPNVSCFLHAKISLSIDILSEHFVYFLFVLSSWRIGLKLAWLWLVACIFLFFWHVRVFVHTSLYIADRPSKVITIIDPKINVGTCILLKISFQFPWSIFFSRWIVTELLTLVNITSKYNVNSILMSNFKECYCFFNLYLYLKNLQFTLILFQ